MPLTLLVGGARSGKSVLATRLAAAQERPVTVVATAEAGDDEMAAKIAAHRAQRPHDWETVEEPLALAHALTRIDPQACVIVDCLTLWVANLVGAGCADVVGASRSAAAVAAARPGPTIAVSNEVGSGLVPVSASSRAYRDQLGTVNASWAAAADRALLVVAGRVLPLAPPESLLDG
jgi:adenosyl cobinamide kinase/adenosyl cobinamide phosphate guanylyltransferase